MKQNLSAHSDGFTSIFDSSNVRSERYFDLTDKSYHGGTTLSSGMLPKWDILNGNYLVKRCGLDSYGNFLTDAFNEETVYLFSQMVGIDCAYYRSIEIKKIPRQKTFGKKLDELLQFSLKYINPEFSFTFNENKLNLDVDSVLEQMTQQRLYSEKRIAFIRKLMKARISDIGQILAKI